MATKKGASSGMGSIVAKATARARAKNNITPNMVNQGPLYTENRPEPANVPNTGTEHLSGVQFPDFAANPVFSPRVNVGSGGMPGTPSMHPGGASAGSSFTPKSSYMHPGGQGYTARSNGPSKLQPSATPSPKVSSGSSGPSSSGYSARSTGVTPPYADPASALNVSGGRKPRGNPNPDAYNPGPAKGKRSAMQVGLSRGSSKGKIRIGWPRKSPHEGMNARHLAKSTGA